MLGNKVKNCRISSLHRVTEAVMPFSSMNNLRKPKRREKQPGKDSKIRLLKKVTTLSLSPSSNDTKRRCCHVCMRKLMKRS